jgi:phage baseplate assembly protein W
MAKQKFININYPFKDSDRGFFIDLNNTDEKAIKADLMHLILTRKGQRLYKPNFGTNLLQFIFEPNDNQTLQGIKDEITDAIKKYLPKLQVDEIQVNQSTESEYLAVVRIDYTITDDVFDVKDFAIIYI